MKKRFLYILRMLPLIILLASACMPTGEITDTNDAPQEPTISLPISPTITPIPSQIPSPETIWIYETGGAIWGTSNITKGTAYFGSDDGNLYAVDARTGNLTWRYSSQGIVRSQPAIANGLLYFASDDGYLYAIEVQSGTQVWRTDIGNFLPREKREILGTSTVPTGFDYFQSSPIVADGQIYIGSLDGNVYALSADSGNIIWTFSTGQKVRATPALFDGVLYIGSWDERMYALDASTGQMIWNTPVGGEVQTTALVAEGIVFTASRKASIFALDAQSGEKKWEYDYGTNMWVESSPILQDGIIYIGSSGNKVVVGLESGTGKALTFFPTRAFNWSTPTIVDDNLYIGGVSFRRESESGLFALKLTDGIFNNTKEWLFQVSEPEKREGNWSGVASSPVVWDGTIYFGGLDGKFYAITMKQ